MSTITAILELQADGTLHLPLPSGLQGRRVRVVASLMMVEEDESSINALQETPLQALKELRKLGGLRHVIPDPVAWQKEQRQDRPLPGRD